MIDDVTMLPPRLKAIEAEAAALGFAMACEHRTGALLRTLAATKPGGRLLELGTGTGASTAWLLDGMDAEAKLLTVDSNAGASAAAQRVLGGDRRVTFHVGEGGALLDALVGQRFDLIFADAWPGKFEYLDAALALLAPGGLYVVDDLLPQPTWPPGHAPRVPALLAALDQRSDLRVTRLTWASGLAIATRRPAAAAVAVPGPTASAAEGQEGQESF
jgi:predicted O-methyltransferase YrrM